MASKSKISRRRWSDAFKKRVVAEASQPGVSLAQIAYRYDLDTGRVSSWTKKFGTDAALMPVEVMAGNDGLVISTRQAATCVEIDLPCGTKVRCGSDADMDLVSRIIAALKGK